MVTLTYRKCTLRPKDRKALERAIGREIKLAGPLCSLNHIDVSNVTDLHALFKDSAFNGDISKWNVANATTMQGMFENSKFFGDVSAWRVENVSDFSRIFYGSAFHGDISAWLINKKSTILRMFNAKQVLEMETPSIFHWRCAEIGILRLSLTLQAYYAEYAPLINNLTSDPVERSYCMHALWRQQAVPNAFSAELYSVDGAVFEETP